MFLLPSLFGITFTLLLALPLKKRLVSASPQPPYGQMSLPLGQVLALLSLLVALPPTIAVLWTWYSPATPLHTESDGNLLPKPCPYGKCPLIVFDSR